MCWFSTSPERSSGWRAEMRHPVLRGRVRVGRTTGRTGLQRDIFRKRFYEPNSCISSNLEKHWNPSWWWLLLMTWRNLHDTSRNLHESSRNLLQKKKICAWLHVFPLHQNHLYTDLHLYLFGAVSQSYLSFCLLDCSPHFAPNKS